MRDLQHINNTLIIGLVIVLLNSCGIDNNLRQIDIDKSMLIIEKMEHLQIHRLTLNYNDLIINDTLIYLDSIAKDTISNRPWTKAQIDIGDWIILKKQHKDSLIILRDLMKNSANKRIIKDNESFFFNEGGWIDSDFGKVYSKTNITDQLDKFTFDRVKEIEPIPNLKNWYTYYAD